MKTDSLFVYGSLLEPSLRRRLLGREIAAKPATLSGYRAYYLNNQGYPALRRMAGGVTPGMLLQGLSYEDLRRLDRYEGELYYRRKLKIRQGFASTRAWVYTLRKGHGRRLSAREYRFRQA